MTEATLRSSRDVEAVFASRRAHAGRVCVLHRRSRRDEHPSRWTVVAGRRLGSAVQRNRAKRRLRAAVRGSELGSGLDLVLVARPAALTCDFPGLQREVVELLRRAVLAREDRRR